jgi:hypothetical protein
VSNDTNSNGDLDLDKAKKLDGIAIFAALANGHEVPVVWL